MVCGGFVVVRGGSVMVQSWWFLVVCGGSAMVVSWWFMVVQLWWFRGGSWWFFLQKSLEKGHVTLYLTNHRSKFTMKSHF